ncbi:hypothetical protein [Mesoterricola silvestris]|uniref:Uncharacterized protein n=1 Tax=Mesoterricola silvestris TaxID=2927979 RepID=A0AA48GX06_9BACT|nr:hypothetical protein [Mesoterricola silvestris]BDU71893.1 hypothetical protein METEAL_10670 [Mesoterricola silvestris]
MTNPMDGALPAALILAFAPASLPAQTRPETMTYIVQEIRSYETEALPMLQVAFSANGEQFTFLAGTLRNPGRSLVVPLRNVDVILVRRRSADGTEAFDLQVRSRGTRGEFLVDGAGFRGTATLISLSSLRKARALERAFTHLTALATGRKDPFIQQVVPAAP